MNSEKADALLKWVNTVNVHSQVNSLQELSDAKFLIQIVDLIDKDYSIEELCCRDDNANWIAKVIKYLEYFYHQPLADFVDHDKITDSHNTLEIGKILSLLLCCAVQGENVSECIDNITSLEEKLQFQLKIIIEAVLKDLDNGKIDPVNLTDVLCQSESFPDVQAISEEYQSSPIIMSPVSFYNSPIKALMASPQMQSRQSQVTISKLYKRLNQFQIQVNNLQRTKSQLEHEIEEKRKQIQEQEFKIQSLSKEVIKVPVLEEEVETLTRVETELNDVNKKCDRLRRSTYELVKYKEEFLKLEKEYSDVVAEKETEKLSLEQRLKELTDKHKEELQCVQSLLDDSSTTCDQLRHQLLEASTIEETLKKQLTGQQNDYVKEIEKLKKAIADSNASRDKLCLKNDQDVLRQISREAELKQCFREREAALQALTDTMQLQNCELKRDIEQLHVRLNKETERKSNLESSLDVSETKLSEAICKYERLQSDFISLGEESKETINKINEDKESVDEALKIAQADWNAEIAHFKKTNKDLLEKLRYDKGDETSCLSNELDEAKEKLFQTFREKEIMQKTMDEFCKEKNLLVEENASFKKKVAEGENLALKLKQLQDFSGVFMAENDALLKENSSLKKSVTELESLKRDVEALRNSLHLAHEEKMCVAKDNIAIKEKICDLEHLAKEFTKLQNHVKGVNEQIQSLEEENLLLKEKAQQAKGFQKVTVNNPCNRSEEPLQEKNSSLKCKIAITDSEEYEALLSRFDVLNEEASLLKKENADMMKDKESLSSECASLRQVLDTVSKDKLALEDSNSSLKDDIANHTELSKEYKVLKDDFCVLKDEKVLVEKENMDLKRKMKHAEDLGCKSETLRQALDKSAQEKLLLTRENALLKDQLQHANEQYNLLKNETASEKSAQNIVIPPMKNLDDDSSVVHYVAETKLHELLMSKLDKIMHKFKVACKQDKQVAGTQEDDIAKIEADLTECYETIVDRYTKNKKKIDDRENCLERESKITEQSKATLEKMCSNEEMNTQIQELRSEMLLLQKENNDLKQIQEENKKELLTERAKVDTLEKNLCAGETKIEKLYNNNVELELAMLSMQDQMKQIQEEKIKLKDYIPQVEAQVVDFEKKLSEEEFISKRLGREVRSLEAQLAHADRQLRQRIETENNQITRQKNDVNARSKIAVNVSKMSLVAEETSSVTEECTTEDSSIADDSIVSEASTTSENKIDSVGNSQEHVDNTSLLCEGNNKERVDSTNMLCQQQEVLKTLRRRSAVYSNKNSRNSVNTKRCSTVGTESFVVGQFSSTVADEPDEHDYEWDRILELKERNSICARHLRSSYPVETQLRLKEEVEEEELKTGECSTIRSRKRLRDNISDSSIFTNSRTRSNLPRSKSEDAFGKKRTEITTTTSNYIHDEKKHLCGSTSEQTAVENLENIEQYNRRESVAFKVDITPAKKSRISLRPRMPRSFAAEKKETARNKSKIKAKPEQTSKKRKPGSVKEDKKPLILRTKRTNFAI